LASSEDGRRASRNVYWLPPRQQEDVFDWTSQDYRLLSFANLTFLSSLPSPHLTVLAQTHHLGRSALSFSNTSPGGKVAFFVRLRLLDGGGADVLPAEWSDNFVTLFAGQNATVTVDTRDKTGASFVLEPFNA
jgi:exo-1,4-beta-D-glucosaminidase